MLPLSYTRYTIQVVTPLTQLTKSHDTVLLARPGPPLSIRLLHTILAGGHFPPKVNDDFCLAFYINPSSVASSLGILIFVIPEIHLFRIYRKINQTKCVKSKTVLTNQKKVQKFHDRKNSFQIFVPFLGIKPKKKLSSKQLCTRIQCRK